MGFSFRKRVRVGKGTSVNLSRRGASLSERLGPVSVSSRGRASVRIAPGLSFRFKI